MKRMVILALGFSILGMSAACARPAPSPPTPTLIPSPTPTETPGPSALECPSFAAFGGLPIGIPIPFPVPGAEVQGSPSPLSPLARQMDEVLRRAFREGGLADPVRGCFFEIRREEHQGVLGIYEFSSPPGADAGSRLQEALRRQGIEATFITMTGPTDGIVWVELRYADGSKGALMLVGTVGWGWAMPPEKEAPGPTPTVETAPHARTPEATETPAAVQPTGLAQEVDSVLRPALESALRVRLRLTDFSVFSMEAGSQVYLNYVSEGTIVLKGQGEPLREQLGRIGLTEIIAVEAPGGITMSIGGGELAGRSIQSGSGMVISANGVEAFLMLR